MKKKIFLNIFSLSIILLFFTSGIDALYAQEESATNKRMAEMMAKMIDEIWDVNPEEGLVNIRIFMTKGEEPFAGKVSIITDFSFRAETRGSQSSQGFNPNNNGRWVYEGLKPGTYKLVVEGFNDFEGWQWIKEDVTVSAGEAPLFEISLD